jgi:hypothetical protein
MNIGANYVVSRHAAGTGVPVNATVEYDANDPFARSVYVDDCGPFPYTQGVSPAYADTYKTIVGDKIFPPYNFQYSGTFYVDPNAPLQYILRNLFPLDPNAPFQYDGIDCAAAQYSCAYSNSNVTKLKNLCVPADCTDKPFRDAAACTCTGSGSTSFRLWPFRAAGTYELDLRVKDNYGQPGQKAYKTIAIDAPHINAVPATSNNLQVGISPCRSMDVWVNRQHETTPAVGSDTSDCESFTVCCDTGIQVKAKDAYGNVTNSTIDLTTNCPSTDSHGNMCD